VGGGRLASVLQRLLLAANYIILYGKIQHGFTCIPKPTLSGVGGIEIRLYRLYLPVILKS